MEESHGYRKGVRDSREGLVTAFLANSCLGDGECPAVPG